MSREPIPMRGGPADGDTAYPAADETVIEVWFPTRRADEEFYARYAVERVNGVPVYAQYLPPTGERTDE